MKINLLKRSVGFFAVIAAILLLGTGCTSKVTPTPVNTVSSNKASANTSNSNSAILTNTTTNIISAFENACQLFSKSEAEAIVGVTLLPPDPVTGRISHSSYDNNYYCVYATKSKGTDSRSVWVGVDRFSSASAARSNYDGEKDRLDRATDMTGFGDLAYWDADQGFLRVIRGKDVFTTQVLYNLTGNQDQAKGIMTTIMQRLP